MWLDPFGRAITEEDGAGFDSEAALVKFALQKVSCCLSGFNLGKVGI